MMIAPSGTSSAITSAIRSRRLPGFVEYSSPVDAEITVVPAEEK